LMPARQMDLLFPLGRRKLQISRANVGRSE